MSPEVIPDPFAEIGEVARAASIRQFRVDNRRSRRWWRLALGLLALMLIVVLAKQLNDRPRYRNGIRYDPIEDDPDIQPALRAAEQETEGDLKDVPRQLGFCHAFWVTKKGILKHKYGIEWHTPKELNPKMMFD